MGAFIYLTANFKGITEEQWEHTYWESLRLLEKFPAPFMTLRLEEVREASRYTYSSNIRKNVGADDECWDIHGDLISYRHCENFRLYRHLEKYTRRYDAILDTDVLFAEKNQISFPRGSGTELFDRKTKGYPYHLAMVAVGILVESRFPDNVYVWGDFDMNCVEELIPWINAVLDKPVAMPICMDAPRLLARLDKLYDEYNSLFKRFTEIFQGSSEEKLKGFLAYGGKSLIFEQCLSDLSDCNSLNQKNAAEILEDLLVVTQDPRIVIDLVQHLKSKKQITGMEVKAFQLTKLLSILTGRYITLDHQERESVDPVIKVIRIISYSENMRFSLVRNLINAPVRINFHISDSQLLDIFSEYEPENREIFASIIRENKFKCRDRIKFINELVANLNQAIRRAEKSGNVHTREYASEDFMGPTIAIPFCYLPGEEYIIDYIHAQKRVYPNTKERVCELGKTLHRMADRLESQRDLVNGFNRESYLVAIYRASEKDGRGFALSESAWANIDAEEDTDILHAILLLAMINDNDLRFCEWRIYVLEHKNLWPYLVSTYHTTPIF